MVRQGMDPLILSIRPPEEAPEHSSKPCDLPITYLPAEKELRAEIDLAHGRARVADGSAAPAAREPARAPTHSAVSKPLGWAGCCCAGASAMCMRTLVGWPRVPPGGSAVSSASPILSPDTRMTFFASTFPVTNARLVKGATLIVTETDFARRWMQEKYPAARRRCTEFIMGLRSPAPGASFRHLRRPACWPSARYVEKKGFADLIESLRAAAEAWALVSLPDHRRRAAGR